MHPVLIRLGALQISTYGVLVAAGYMTGILWLKTQIRDMPGIKGSEDKFWTLIYIQFFGAVMGGKLLFMAATWRLYASGELSFFGDFRYGFVFFGGLLGSMVTGVYACRRLKLPYLGTADYFGVALPMGHTLGRLACLFAGCCYGKVTNMPWGVAAGGSPASSTPPELWGLHLHPTPVYESAANAAIFSFLLAKVLPKIKKGRLPAGTAFLLYVLLYSAARFVIEFYRGDDRGFSYGGLWVSQWIAVACAGGCSAVLARIGAFRRLRAAA